jgi:hypothetical protein
MHVAREDDHVGVDGRRRERGELEVQVAQDVEAHAAT